VNNNDVETTYDRDIEAFVQDCGDHEYIRRPRVLRWLKQFGDDEAPLAMKVLKNIRYFGASNLLVMSNKLVDMVANTYPHTKSSAVFYVPVGGPGTGSHIVARHLRINPNVPNANVVDLLALYRESKRRKVEVVVFLEDFSGTGNTIQEWWSVNAPIVLPIGCTVVLGVLVLNSAARALIDEDLTTLTVQELTERDNVLSPESDAFGQSEKDRILDHCMKTSCSEPYLRGYGKCGLLVAFQHGCPNDSLPILWHESTTWEALFKRRSV